MAFPRVLSMLTLALGLWGPLQGQEGAPRLLTYKTVDGGAL